MTEISKEEAVVQLRELALEAEKLADAFRPSAREGATIVIPVVMAMRLAEVLGTAANAMRAVAAD